MSGFHIRPHNPCIEFLFTIFAVSLGRSDKSRSFCTPKRTKKRRGAFGRLRNARKRACLDPLPSRADTAALDLENLMTVVFTVSK